MARNGQEGRKAAVQELKKKGKKLIGTVTSYVPEELIWAAGMIPIRLSGSWREHVAQAQVYRPVNSDKYCTHLLQSILQGDWDMLDGIVFSYYDDDVRRLWDVLMHIKWKPFLYMLYVPYRSDDRARKMFRHALDKFAKALGQYSGVGVTNEQIQKAIGTYNEWRNQLGGIYEMRKKAHPSLSGAEVLALTTASFVMPKDQFSTELKALVPYLETRKPKIEPRPRILVSSDALDHPGYLSLVEEGALVAMDDLDTGSRYFWRGVNSNTDALQALADRYLLRPPDPRTFEWARHIEQVIQWVKDYKIDGVLNLVPMYSQWRQVEVPYFRESLTQAGIQNMYFEREYHLANVGQLRTRIGAFVESLA